MCNLLMTLRALPLALATALLATPAAYAQVYKWVDEKGVINYSSTPPDKRKSQKLDEDKGRVSTIESYDFQKEDAARRERALKDRIDRLEQDAQRTRQQSGQQSAAGPDPAAAAEAQRQWRERCIAERRTDCDSPYASRLRPRVLHPVLPSRRAAGAAAGGAGPVSPDARCRGRWRWGGGPVLPAAPQRGRGRSRTGWRRSGLRPGRARRGGSHARYGRRRRSLSARAGGPPALPRPAGAAAINETGALGAG